MNIFNTTHLHKFMLLVLSNVVWKTQWNTMQKHSITVSNNDVRKIV